MSIQAFLPSLVQCLVTGKVATTSNLWCSSRYSLSQSVSSFTDMDTFNSTESIMPFFDRTREISTNYPPLFSPLLSLNFWVFTTLFITSLFTLLKGKVVDFVRKCKVRDTYRRSFVASAVICTRDAMRQPQKQQPIFHCFHGFGASSLSFKPLLDRAPHRTRYSGIWIQSPTIL